MSNELGEIGNGIKKEVAGTIDYYRTKSRQEVLTDAKDFFTHPKRLEDALTFYAGAELAKVTATALTKPRPPVPTRTVYRGVNENNYHYKRALKGVVKGNRGNATALEYNSVSTLNSPHSSWTFNKDVAINFALRDVENLSTWRWGQGGLLEAEIPLTKLVASPDTKKILLIHTQETVRESEILSIGTIRGAKVTPVPPIPPK